MCKKYNVNKFIFSSTAILHGDNEVPFTETMDFKPTTNPYGETKAIIERIIRCSKSKSRSFSSN